MKPNLGTVAAVVLLAGTAYVLPAHAQNGAQPQPYGTYGTSAQIQPYGTMSQTQPYGTSGWSQTQPYGTSGRSQTQPFAGVQPYGAATQTQIYGATPTAQPYGASNQMQSQLPQGAYLSNCKEARMLEGTLIAFCEKPDGTWQTTELRASQCPNPNDIQNVNGDLACGLPTGYGSSTPPATLPPNATQQGY